MRHLFNFDAFLSKIRSLNDKHKLVSNYWAAKDMPGEHQVLNGRRLIFKSMCEPHPKLVGHVINLN